MVGPVNRASLPPRSALVSLLPFGMKFWVLNLLSLGGHWCEPGKPLSSGVLKKSEHLSLSSLLFVSWLWNDWVRPSICSLCDMLPSQLNMAEICESRSQQKPFLFVIWSSLGLAIVEENWLKALPPLKTDLGTSLTSKIQWSSWESQHRQKKILLWRTRLRGNWAHSKKTSYHDHRKSKRIHKDWDIPGLLLPDMSVKYIKTPSWMA